MASGPPAVTEGGAEVMAVSKAGGSGAGNTVHVYVAGVWSTIGSPSMFTKRLTARTSNSCSSPDSGSPEVSGPAVNGELHGTHSDPSTEHWNVTPCSAVWSDENVNCALPRLVSAGGPGSVRRWGVP